MQGGSERLKGRPLIFQVFLTLTEKAELLQLDRHTLEMSMICTNLFDVMFQLSCCNEMFKFEIEQDLSLSNEKP